jgi:hypothetical protein
MMIKIETTARVRTTCCLTDEDEKKVRAYMEENVCDLDDAVRELFWNDDKFNIYKNSTESDFYTTSIDEVWEE